MSRATAEARGLALQVTDIDFSYDQLQVLFGVSLEVRASTAGVI